MSSKTFNVWNLVFAKTSGAVNYQIILFSHFDSLSWDINYISNHLSPEKHFYLSCTAYVCMQYVGLQTTFLWFIGARFAFLKVLGPGAEIKARTLNLTAIGLLTIFCVLTRLLINAWIHMLPIALSYKKNKQHNKKIFRNWNKVLFNNTMQPLNLLNGSYSFLNFIILLDSSADWMVSRFLPGKCY